MYGVYPATFTGRDGGRGYCCGSREAPQERLHGVLGWKAGVGPGTVMGKEKSIKLKGKYTLHWEGYSELKSESFPQQYNTTFKYLLLEVQKETSY